jgi:hypothetical protein
MIEIEVCLFNSLAAYAADSRPLKLALPKGTRADVLPESLRIPAGKIYAAWRNGRDIMTTFGGAVVGVTLEHGDRIAFSGPVPFSRGYGAPVC